MKVMATKQGYYCNTFVEEGWVFELLNEPDGSVPLRRDWVAKLDANGKDTGKGAYVIFKDACGKTRHRDFAPDEGEVLIEDGPGRGEAVQIGWMQEMPEATEVTLDLSEFRYGFDANTRKLNRTKPHSTVKRVPVKPITLAG